ncbi:MAG TPA: MYXO-CTERM sorting domain-containing protein, partial [Myxococcaceae bacterium]|nr:MYXO-CTERM sorting domain-containing protein [Myxococcaceae bacterium]
GTGATVSGVPDQEFSASLGTTPRAAGSALDLGAYGFPRASDGGTPDAGAPGDAGVPDGGGGGGPPTDGPAGPGQVIGSCSSASGGIPLLAVAVLVALLARRRSVNSRS